MQIEASAARANVCEWATAVMYDFAEFAETVFGGIFYLQILRGNVGFHNLYITRPALQPMLGIHSEGQVPRAPHVQQLCLRSYVSDSIKRLMSPLNGAVGQTVYNQTPLYCQMVRSQVVEIRKWGP